MAFAGSWNGKAADCPPLREMVTQDVSTFHERGFEHVERVSNWIKGLLDEQPEHNVAIGVSGQCDEAGNSVTNVNVSLTAPPESAPPVPGTPVPEPQSPPTPAEAVAPSEPVATPEPAAPSEPAQEPGQPSGDLMT